MEHTRDNIIKVLEAVHRNHHDVAEIYRERGDKEEYRRCVREAIGVISAAEIIRNKATFEFNAENYGVTDE